jgi:predicted nuclease of restriction endonuclease-like (RecB) superfamily
MKKTLSENEYKAFVTEIKAKVYQSQHQALRQVNRELINLYWEIGRSIVERQEKYGWGKSIVANLSKDLQNEFPGVNGFSVQNLWFMRKFYKKYEHFAKLQQSVREIGWGHNIVIMNKCKTLEESQFYMEMTRKYGWTRARPTSTRRSPKNTGTRRSWRSRTSTTWNSWSSPQTDRRFVGRRPDK